MKSGVLQTSPLLLSAAAGFVMLWAGSCGSAFDDLNTTNTVHRGRCGPRQAIEVDGGGVGKVTINLSEAGEFSFEAFAYGWADSFVVEPSERIALSKKRALNNLNTLVTGTFLSEYMCKLTEAHLELVQSCTNLGSENSKLQWKDMGGDSSYVKVAYSDAELLGLTRCIHDKL